jgi:hypothetical protein
MYLQTLFEKARASSDDTSAAILSQLLDALENDAPFDLQQLYLLSYNDFDIALNALREWRSQRYVWMREHESDQPWRSHTA